MVRRILWNEPTDAMSGEVPLEFSIRGVRYEALRSDLVRHPDTALGRLARQHAPGETEESVYVFRRNPDVFSQLLEYYETGQLHYPPKICPSVFQDELTHWGIDCPVSPCCHAAYMTALNNSKVVEAFRQETEEERKVIKDWALNHGENLRAKIWLLINYPSSSILGKLYAAIVYLAVVIFLVVAILENNALSKNAGIGIPTAGDTVICPLLKGGYLFKVKSLMWMHVLDLLTSILFLWDNFLHLATSPRHLLFSFRNILEWISFFPSFVFFLHIQAVNHGVSPCGKATVCLILLRSIKVARVLQFYVLFRNTTYCRVLVFIFKKNIAQMFTLFLLACMYVLIFGTVVFMADGFSGENGHTTAWEFIYMAVISLATVGYGDIYPETIAARFFTALFALGSLFYIAAVVVTLSKDFYVVSQAASDVVIQQLRKEHAQKREASGQVIAMGPVTVVG